MSKFIQRTYAYGSMGAAKNFLLGLLPSCVDVGTDIALATEYSTTGRRCVSENMEKVSFGQAFYDAQPCLS